MESNIKTTEATVAGLFHDRASADKAVADLRTAGFAASAIEELGSEPSRTTTESGGFMNALGRFFGDEPTRETTGAMTTSVSDRLTAFGLDNDDAREFQSRLDAGGVLVILHADNRGVEALEILKRNGATPAQLDPVTATTIPAATVAPLKEQGARRLQLLKEVLRVNKERVQYGEVQLRKEVVSEQQTLEVPVTREEIVIERHPVADGEAATGTIGDGETIRVPLSEERVSVEKRNVVSEEVTIGTREVQETRKIDETVRREELRTDEHGEIIGDKQPQLPRV